MVNNNATFFLLQPLNPNFKEMIVYSETEDMARQAAEVAFHGANSNSMHQHSSDGEPDYKNKGMTICIQIDPNIVTTDIPNGEVKIKYNEVVYVLTKDKAQEVIAEKFL